MSKAKPLGRIAPSSFGPRQAQRIVRSLEVAPSIWTGDLPRRVDLTPFRNPRYRNQSIGSCVGQSGAAMAETTIRTPSPLDLGKSQPQSAIDLSPLWCYYVARQVTAKYDASILRGEGALVYDALTGVIQQGFVRMEAWPDDPATQKAYRDKPPADAIAAAKLTPLKDARRLEDWDHVLAMIASGYSVWIGVPWPSGAMNTDASGRFRWSGRTVGGHAVELNGYDLDAKTVSVGNSWMEAGWGVGPCVGTTDLDPVSKLFTPKRLSTGDTEAGVVTDLEGWRPKTRSWSDVL